MAYNDWFLHATDFRQTTNIKDVLNEPIKIACLPVWFDSEIEIDVSKFDLVLISDIEFNNHYKIYNWINNLKIKNYLVKVGGLDTIPIAPTLASGELPINWIYRPFWSFLLTQTNEFQDTANLTKPYLFDVLLGARRPHRDYAMARFQKSALLNQSIVNYRNIFNGGIYTEPAAPVQEILQGDNLWWPYVSDNLNSDWEVMEDLTDLVSRTVPWEIYRQTKYSVVCETLWEYSDFFLTEKTTKPMWAKRVFVVLSGKHFLKNLRELGFLTFGEIIDESYDDIDNPYQRWKSAIDELENLTRQDYSTVCKKIEYIVEHNHKVLSQLRNEVDCKTRQMITNKIKELT